ncbi:UNVERIFIED_CONTAM: hypothetical protein K2H54_057485 [Gekko kuhli]
MQYREIEKPSVFEAEILQLPPVTVTSNKPVVGLNAGTKAEAIGKVEIEKEESKISLQLPAKKQASSDLSSASSEENKLSQNTCLLEFVSGEMKDVSAEENSTDTSVEKKVTVEVNSVVTEKSKENLSDPAKENPEKLQNESILLGEDVEAKEIEAQNAVLKKERKEIDLVVTETNIDPKEDNNFANEYQLCQFNTETVPMIEQLMDQRPRNAQLVKVQLHWTAQMLALMAATMGLAFIISSKNRSELPHFVSWHSCLGLLTLLAMCGQILCGLCLWFPWQLKFFSVAQLQQCHLMYGLVVYLSATFTVLVYSSHGAYPTPWYVTFS